MVLEREKPVREESKEQEGIETRMVDVGREREEAGRVPKEVMSWMEEMERAPGVGQVGSKAKQGPGLKPAAPADPKIKLPVTRKAFTTGFSQAVSEVGRWCSTFILRLIKIKKGKVEFKDES